MFSKNIKTIACFDDFFEALKELPTEERQLISEVATICKLIHVNPATSASGERSFSMARRLKTWLRSTMAQERFNSLAILNAHKKRTDSLSLIEVANIFVCNENRHINFGRFVKEDEESKNN